MRPSPSPRCLLLAVMLCLAGPTQDAAAAITIALEWGACGGGTGLCSATGTNSISVNYEGGAGQTLRLDIYLSHDLAQGLESHTFSLEFDTNLENELNLGPMAQSEWAGSDVDPGAFVSTYGPIQAGVTSRESSGGVVGRINSFESGGFTGVLPANGTAYSVGTTTATAPARYRVGQAYFTVNGPTPDGEDIFSGLFNVGYDQIIDGNGNLVPTGTINFSAAYVNPTPGVPEPGTVSLLGLGLVGLILARRRSRG